MGCVGVKKCIKIKNIQDSPPLLTTKLIHSNKLGLNMNIKKEGNYLNMDYNNISKGNLLIVLSVSERDGQDYENVFKQQIDAITKRKLSIDIKI